MNECEEDEYQCLNGQCIPKSFSRDDSNIPDSLDRSDERLVQSIPFATCPKKEPAFGCEDVICNQSFMSSSCLTQHLILLMKAMYSVKENSTNEECWSAFKCILGIPDAEYPLCDLPYLRRGGPSDS